MSEFLQQFPLEHKSHCTQRSPVQLRYTLPPLIHVFQLKTVINMLHTVHISVLIDEVAEKFLQQSKGFPSLVKQCLFSSYKIHNALISGIWLNFWYFTVSKTCVNTILKDLFLALFRKMHTLEMLLMNHPTIVTASQFLVKNNFLWLH